MTTLILNGPPENAPDSPAAAVNNLKIEDEKALIPLRSYTSIGYLVWDPQAMKTHETQAPRPVRGLSLCLDFQIPLA
jgi:hypothetical protein